MASASRVAPLDGIRAIAVTMVIAFHFTSISQFPLDWLGPLATPVVHGWIGVDLFFGLSGFLITRLWMAEEDAASDMPPAKRARRFYARRALRILPIYYLTLFGFLLLACVVPLPSIVPFAHRVDKTWTTLLPYIFFFANYVGFSRDGAFGARWSLCIEEHFYILWPFVLVALRQRRHRMVAAIVVCVAVLGARIIALLFADHRHGWGSNMMVHYASHMRIDSIMWGCVAALAYDVLAREVRTRRAALVVSATIALYLIFSGGITPLKGPTLFGGSIGPSVLAITAALLSAEVTAAPKSWLARGLSLQPLPTLGFHSYAIYLIHPLAVDVIVRLFGVLFRTTARPTIAHWALGVVLTVAVAFVGALALHVVAERPLRNVRARLR